MIVRFRVVASLFACSSVRPIDSTLEEKSANEIIRGVRPKNTNKFLHRFWDILWHLVNGGKQ